MNELKSVQFACEQLKSRMDSVEIGTDTSEVQETQGNFSHRINRFEKSVNLEHLNYSLHRVIRLEKSVGLMRV